jgi:hypothetical protein
MVANNNNQYQNGKTLDVVSILVFDATGQARRLWHGPAVDGDVTSPVLQLGGNASRSSATVDSSRKRG